VRVTAEHKGAALGQTVYEVGLVPEAYGGAFDALHGKVWAVAALDGGVDSDPVDVVVPPVLVAEEFDADLLEYWKEEGGDTEFVIVVAGNGGDGAVHSAEGLEGLTDPARAARLPDIDVVPDQGDEVGLGIEGHLHGPLGAADRIVTAEVEVSEDGDAVATMALGPALQGEGVAVETQVIDAVQHAADEGAQSRRSGGGKSESPRVHALTIGKSLALILAI
jgi:hypothetical protein